MKFVDNARKAWRWFSVQAMAAAAAIQGAWLVVPESLRASITPEVLQCITIGLLVLGVAGRLVKQDGTDGEVKK